MISPPNSSRAPFAINTLFRRKGVQVFLVAFLLVSVFGIFSLARNSSAESASSEAASRAAEAASKDLLAKIQKSAKSASISSLGGGCSNGVLQGENAFGTYRVVFRNVSQSKLSCGSALSRIAALEITGFSGGVSTTIRYGAPSEGNQTQKESRCTGNLPDNTTPHPGDDDALTADLSWKYATGNTSRKCEYTCETGASWDGNSCARFSCEGLIPAHAERYDAEEEESISGDIRWDYSSSDTSKKCQYRCLSGYSWDGSFCTSTAGSGETNVTTGSENQVKQGAFGVNGLFKAYGGIDVDEKKIENVADPIDASDMANKAYVDEAIRKAFEGK